MEESSDVLEMRLRVDTRAMDDLQIVSVAGDIDIATARTLEEALLALIDQGHVHLVVDLNAVKYLDSSGLGSLIKALRRVKDKDGRIWIISRNPRVEKVLSITGLTEVFEVFPTLEALLISRKE